MSKFINVTVSASLSTDFYLEVPDNATEEEIKLQAQQTIILPHKYPEYIHDFLRNNLGIRIGDIDSLVKSWNIDEVEYIIENEKGQS